MQLRNTFLYLIISLLCYEILSSIEDLLSLVCTFHIKQESSSEVSEITSKLSSTHLDKPGGSAALKLPPLFSLTPSSSGKATQMQKQNALTRQPSQEVTSEEKTLTFPSTKDQTNGSVHGISVLLFSLPT